MCRVAVLSLLAAVLSPVDVTADLTSALQTVRAVGHEGAGHAAAQRAVQELSGVEAAGLVEILAAMDGANPLAANWLRGAFETAAARAAAAPAGLPVKALLAFYHERSHEPRARRLAYEWIIRARPSLREELIAAALDDPSAEMRSDAVARLLVQAQAAAESGAKEQAEELYRQALQGAGDPQQVDPIAKALKQLGETVNLVEHYGLLTDWYVIGPFDNREMKGFPVAYPPEQQVDLTATYAGQQGEVRWQKLTSTEADGTFDLAALTAPHKGAIDYVTTEFTSDREQPVEFRLATANAWKLWLNGELLFAREEYHRGMRFDQYRVAGRLRAGSNRILIKVCQNEQDQSWAQKWSFQFRVCDPYGRALRSAGQVAQAASSGAQTSTGGGQ